jgi:acetyl esterase
LTVLEAGMQTYLAEVDRRLGAGIDNPSLHDRRLRAEQLAQAMMTRPREAIVTRNWYVPLSGREIPLRIYRHRDTRPRPLLVFFHGGGWVTGSLDSHHYLAEALAADGDCVVVSVHYRRPPETPFPGPVDDCFEALSWASGNGAFLGADTTRIAVGGDSAGGYLAAAVAMRARDRGTVDVRFQLLIYPMISPDFDRPSYRAFSTAPVLTRADSIFYWKAMFGDLDRAQAEGDLAQARAEALPPAYVLTAEIDPLRDEGEVFAERLRAAGVAVELRRAIGVPHGFLRAAEFSEAARLELERAGRSLLCLHGAEKDLGER